MGMATVGSPIAYGDCGRGGGPVPDAAERLHRASGARVFHPGCSSSTRANGVWVRRRVRNGKLSPVLCNVKNSP